MENDKFIVYGLVVSACFAPLVYSLTSSTTTKERKSVGTQTVEVPTEPKQSNAANVQLSLMLQCGVMTNLVRSQEEELATAIKEGSTLKHENSDLCTQVAKWKTDYKSLETLSAHSESKIKQLLKEKSRLAAISGLSIRQSRLREDELRSARSKLATMSRDRNEFQTALQDALLQKDHVSSKLHEAKRLLAERDDLISRLNAANHEAETKIKAQRYALQDLVEEKERLRMMSQRHSREHTLVNDSFSDLDPPSLKGSFNPKSAIRRLQGLGSLKLGPKKGLRSKVNEGQANLRSATT